MKLSELTEKLNLEILSDIYDDCEITGTYSGDLLSDVISNAKKGNIWVTMQKHLNIAAVATLKEISAIIIVMNKKADEDMITAAKKENITVLGTALSSYQISGRIYELGIR
jgi:hypothetical protein